MTQVLDNSPAAWSQRAASPCPLDAVGWTEEGQRDRFDAVLSSLAPQSGESLLDYGCGTGALSDLLTDDIEYLGVDWADGMISRAKKDHPGRKFRSVRPQRAFDLIACVGPFNLPAGWSKASTWQTLRELWQDCARAMAVSLYAGEDEHCIRYEPGQLLAFAQTTARLWRIERHRPNDLLLVLHR